MAIQCMFILYHNYIPKKYIYFNVMVDEPKVHNDSADNKVHIECIWPFLWIKRVKQYSHPVVNLSMPIKIYSPLPPERTAREYPCVGTFPARRKMFPLISQQRENTQWEGLKCAMSRTLALLWAPASSPGGDPMPFPSQGWATSTRTKPVLNWHRGWWVPASPETLHAALQFKRLHYWSVFPDPEEYASFLVKWESPTAQSSLLQHCTSAVCLWASFPWSWASASNKHASVALLDLCKSCEHKDISHFVQNVKNSFFSPCFQGYWNMTKGGNAPLLPNGSPFSPGSFSTISLVAKDFSHHHITLLLTGFCKSYS